MGFIDFKIPKNARSSLNGKRSIYVVKDIKGEIFNEENIKIIRPSFGLNPKYYEKILQKNCKKKI